MDYVPKWEISVSERFSEYDHAFQFSNAKIFPIFELYFLGGYDPSVSWNRRIFHELADLF